MKLILSTFILLFWTLKSFGATLGPATSEVGLSDYSQIVIDSIWSELGHPIPAPIPIKKEIQNKTQNEIPKESRTSPSKSDPIKKPGLKKPEKVTFPGNKVSPKKDGPLKIDQHKQKISNVPNKLEKRPSPLDKYRQKNGSGNSKVQAMLKKNREALKRKREQEKKSESSVKTNDDSMSLVERRNQGLNRLKRNVQKTYSNWENKIKETYKRWDQKRKIYKKNIPTYKSNTFEIELQSSGASFQSSPKPLNPLQSAKKSAFHIIPGALDVPVKDQGKRPTCAAFAGVRAIETILKGHNRDVDLSEQYFYWSSKPKCQNRPCQKKGSWVYNGFKRSMRKPRPDIPSDGSCPYQAFPKQDNETQIPLRPSCQQGVTQVKGFKELKSLGEILTSLEQNSPVVGGFKLSPNFYQTKGLVSYQESFRSGSTDSHAQGHALLLVGFMELPKERWNTEGKYCLLTANSWGEGWGKGGFGCLSEKWVRNHMIPNAFISLTKVGL